MATKRRGGALSKAELVAEARRAVAAGRVGVRGERVTLDGIVVRSPRIAEALADAAIARWLRGRA